MKSTMKSTFAIIAVALMVMVAIVPMAGQFSSGVAPDTVVVPTVKDPITITGKVFEADGTTGVTPGTNYVLISYSTYNITANWGEDPAYGFSAVLQETFISTVTIKYVDKDGVVVAGFAPVTLTGLVSGTYNANIVKTDTKPGMTSATLTLKMADGTTTLGSLGDVSGTYSVYESATSTAFIDSGSFAKDGTATIYYKSADKVFIKVKDVKIDGMQDGAISFAAATTPVQCTIDTAATSLKANEYDIPVTLAVGNSTVSLLITELKFTPAEATAVTLKYISRAINTTTTTAHFTMTSAKDASGTYAAKVGYDTTTVQEATAAYSNPNVQITPRVLIGQVSMGTVHQAGTLTLSYAGATTTDTITAAVNDNGYFARLAVANVDTYTATKMGNFVANDEQTVMVATSSELSAVGLSTDGFKLVSGTMSLADYEANKIATKELTIGGTTTTFGPLKTKADGTFAFYATEKARISIAGKEASGSSVKYTGDISVVPGAASTGLKVYMSSQDVKVLTQDALGGKLTVTGLTMGTTAAPASVTISDIQYKSGYVTGKIRGDLTASSYNVTLTLSGYAFTAAAYAKDKVFKAAEANYKLAFYEIGTTTPLLTIGVTPVAYLSNVYINSTGSYVYEPISEIALGAATAGVYTVKLDAAYVSVTPNKTVQKAVVIYGADASASYIFDKAYVFSPNADGEYDIYSAADSLSGVLTKTDEKTPIANATVKLMLKSDTEDTTVYTTTTNTDGSFTVISDKKLKSGAIGVGINYLTFQREGYTFTAAGYPLIVEEDADKIYKATGDYYVATLKDTDGTYVAVENGTITVGGVVLKDTYGLGLFTGTGELVKDTEYNVATSASVGRTIAKYTATAEDIAAGVLAFESKESAYKFKLTDADGNVIKGNATGVTGIVYKVYKVAEGELDAGTAVTPEWNSTNTVGSIVLSDLEYPYTAYYLTATLGDAQGKYVFNKDTYVALSTEETAVMVSESKVIVVDLYDAVGNKLIASGTAPTVTGKNTVAQTATVNDGSFYFLAWTGNASYTIDLVQTTVTDAAGIGARANYFPNTTTGAQYTMKIGTPVLTSKNMLYTIAVTDGVGEGLDADDGVLKGYTDGSVISETIEEGIEVNGGLARFVAPYGDFDEYQFSSETLANTGYSFDNSALLVFIANEGTYYANFVTANGYDIDNIAAFDIEAYDENGNVIYEGDEEGIIADLEEVAYFKATNTGNWKFLPSETLNFVATDTYITGTVPYTGKVDNGVVAIELYLDGDFVKEYRSDDEVSPIAVDKYDYVAYIDLTGYISDTAGVVFDSILAVYYENGAEIASSAVNPYTAVNNIVSPIIETYEAVLLPPSVLIASHVDIDQIGDVVTVTADANFMIADDEGVYTDGQYTYTFAGWYVNNQKVSASPVYTFELNDNVVISPQYTVTYEKTSDANDKQTPQPQPVQPDNSIDTNVLIIGICAVIVALIAVVYAVIKKE